MIIEMPKRSTCQPRCENRLETSAQREGRVCRAMVTLQLCALSSRAGQHAEALEEARC